MKKYIYIFLLLPFFLCGSTIYKKQLPIIQLSIYEIAEQVTGAPANILKAIAIVESNENDSAIGDDGISMGRMQINELYREERVSKYGDYNPFDALDSVILSGHIYMANFNIFKDHDKAIAAHRQGRRGVLKYGATKWYVDRVRNAMEAKEE